MRIWREAKAGVAHEHRNAVCVSTVDANGGFRLRPYHVEFLDFREDRLHRRTAYNRDGEQWRKSFLQP